jgi:hypothetical protein
MHDQPIDTLPRGVRVIRIVLIAAAVECAAIGALVMHVLQGQC